MCVLFFCYLPIVLNSNCMYCIVSFQVSPLICSVYFCNWLFLNSNCSQRIWNQWNRKFIPKRSVDIENCSCSYLYTVRRLTKWHSVIRESPNFPLFFQMLNFVFCLFFFYSWCVLNWIPPNRRVVEYHSAVLEHSLRVNPFTACETRLTNMSSESNFFQSSICVFSLTLCWRYPLNIHYYVIDIIRCE